MDISEARSVLSSRGWLTRTPAPFSHAVLSNCELRQFAAGETIYKQGDNKAGVWGLVDGTLGVELYGHHRDPGFAYFARSGFWIGAYTLVIEPVRKLGLVATKPSALLYLSSAAYQEVIREVPDAWRWLSVLPLMQSALAFGTLEDLMIRDPKRRCAAILLRLAGCRGPLELDEPGEIFVTQEQLAEMINISRTVLGGILRGFEDQGYISRQYGKLKIDRNLLEDVLNRAFE